MASISVVIATYGADEWEEMAFLRAVPSLTPAGVTEQVIIYHSPEGTRASSLNSGAARATGDWLIFLDADDELGNGYVPAMLKAIESDGESRRGLERPGGVRHGGARHGEVPPLFTPSVQQIRKGRPGAPFFFPECSLETGNWLVIGTMVSRELFNEVGGFHEHPHGLEDWNFFARCVRAGARIVKVRDAVYRAFVNPQSEHHKLQRRRGEYMEAYERARVDAWG